MAARFVGAEPFLPPSRRLADLAAAAQGCRGCDLYEDATQVVFGAGPRTARLCLVGEQPGDQEDRRGAPFVGPAGRVLHECLAEAGIPERTVYLTNAVKHFRHELRGKRRIHQRPTTAEIEACHPWVATELAVVRPAVVVLLGAVAARGLLGRSLGIAESRGQTFAVDGRPAVVTYHPSAVLRADDRAAELRAALVADLHRAAVLAEAAG